MEGGQQASNIMSKKKVFLDPNIDRKSKIYDASFKLMEELRPS